MSQDATVGTVPRPKLTSAYGGFLEGITDLLDENGILRDLQKLGYSVEGP